MRSRERNEVGRRDLGDAIELGADFGVRIDEASAHAGS